MINMKDELNKQQAAHHQTKSQQHFLWIQYTSDPLEHMIPNVDCRYLAGLLNRTRLNILQVKFSIQTYFFFGSRSHRILGLVLSTKIFSEFWQNCQNSENFLRFSNCVPIKIFWGKFSEILSENFSDFLKKIGGSKFSDFCQKISQNSDFCW